MENDKIRAKIKELQERIDYFHEKIHEGAISFERAKPFITSYKMLKLDLEKRLENT